MDVSTAKFPNRQRLAETTDLRLGVENAGKETIPDLAVTIFIDDGTQGSFNIRLDQPGLANPNRPVWVLEDKYPRLAGESRPLGTAPGDIAAANTFAFGALDPGDRREMIWKVTPVRGGTYTVNYEIAAGLHGQSPGGDRGRERAGREVRRHHLHEATPGQGQRRRQGRDRAIGGERPWRSR